MATEPGTCSHPACDWTGQSENWKKHKQGRGKGEAFKPGKHYDCECCHFVPPSSVHHPLPALSSLQMTLALLPAYSSVQMHEHMRGEFCRRAAIPAREENFEKNIDPAVLERHKRFCKEAPLMNGIIQLQAQQFFQSASKRFDFLQTNQQHVLAHVMIDDQGQVSSQRKFRFVADKNNKYKTTIASFVQYVRGVFLVQDSVAKILKNALDNKSCHLTGFILYQVATAKSLDILQHTLMNMELGLKASVLVEEKHENIAQFAMRSLNELNGSPWSTLKGVRRIAVSCASEDDKDTHIRWPDVSSSISTIDYIDEYSGTSTTITIEQIRSFANALQNRAEEILRIIGVQELTDEQINSIKDLAESAGANITLCNPELVELLKVADPTTKTERQALVKLITELTKIVLDLAAIEGSGHMRYTETVSSLFTDPSQFDRRTLRWETGRLSVTCGWFKSETTATEAALAIKRATWKTCTKRTSDIFVRTALAVKPLEVRVTHELHGPVAASVHWMAFCARDGKDLCDETNLHWARAHFNRIAALHMSVGIHELRHVLIAIGRRVCDTYADQQATTFKTLIMNAQARMSFHSGRQERSSYAGEAGAVQGHEARDRAVYRMISDNFNLKVFGADVQSARIGVKLDDVCDVPINPVNKQLQQADGAAAAPHAHSAQQEIQELVCQSVRNGQSTLLVQRGGFGKSYLSMSLLGAP